MLTIVHTVLGFVLSPPRRDERGLSQSTENALLLAGAVTVAAAVVAAVTAFINGKLGAIK